MSAVPSLNLLVNIADPGKAGLLQSFGNNFPANLPLFIRNDGVPVSLRFVAPSATTSRPWDDVDFSTATVALAIGVPDKLPSSGTFTLTFGANTTSALTFNVSAAAMQTALNALASISGAGGVTVISPATGVYLVQFNGNGAQTAIAGDGTGLNPTTNVVVSQVVPGTVGSPEIQSIELRAAPYALNTAWSPFPVAAAQVETLNAGTGSGNNIQQVTLNPVPYAGTFLVTVDAGTSSPIPYNATAQQVQAALPTGYAVTGDAGGPWQITRTATGSVSAYTVDVSGLLVPVGLTGTLKLSTFSMLLAFLSIIGNDLGAEMEIQVTPAGGDDDTPLQVGVTIAKDVINFGAISPAPGVNYYTADQVDAGFVHNQPQVTAFTGGGANDFDAIPTITRSVGQLHAAVVGGILYLWKLISGVLPESYTVPNIIPPVDYNASTNQKYWSLCPVSLDAVVGASTSSISSAISTMLELGVGQLFLDQEYDYDAGGAPYVHTITLAVANAVPGSVIDLTLGWPNSTNPSAVVKNGGPAADTLASPESPGTASSNFLQCAFNGTNWKLRQYS